MGEGRMEAVERSGYRLGMQAGDGGGPHTVTDAGRPTGCVGKPALGRWTPAPVARLARGPSWACTRQPSVIGTLRARYSIAELSFPVSGQHRHNNAPACP